MEEEGELKEEKKIKQTNRIRKRHGSCGDKEQGGVKESKKEGKINQKWFPMSGTPEKSFHGEKKGRLPQQLSAWGLGGRKAQVHDKA